MTFHLQKLQAKIRDFWIGPIPVFKTNTGRRLKWPQFNEFVGGNIEWHFEQFQSSLLFPDDEGSIIRPRLRPSFTVYSL